MKINTTNLIIAGAVIGVAVYYIEKTRNAVVDSVEVATDFVTDNNNPINQGFNSIYSKVTGSKGTFGGDLYSLLN